MHLRLFCLAILASPPPASPRFMVMALSAVIILAVATIVTKGAPLKFIVGMDNRYSNSKCQAALWFWIVISSYIATVIFRVWHVGWGFLGSVNIPQNLLVLSGLSALTYGGAKAITTAKVNAAVAQAAAAGGPAAGAASDPKNALLPGQESLFRDLMQNDAGAFDFGDFQAFLVTVLAAVMYVLLVFHFLGTEEFTKTVATLPDVDTTLLAAFGVGQGAYLTKKAAGNVGTS